MGTGGDYGDGMDKNGMTGMGHTEARKFGYRSLTALSLVTVGFQGYRQSCGQGNPHCSILSFITVISVIPKSRVGFSRSLSFDTSGA